MATLKDDEYVQLPRGRFKLVAKTKEELEKEGYGYHHSANGYSVYVKNNRAVAIKDAVHANDANYEQWTKQGWRVVALYKDGGRIHAIVERKSGDFVVALGYNTSTGEWAQGRYVSTFGAAVDTLNEEKPGAVPIRDAKPTKKTFEVSFVKDGVTYVRKVKADSIQDAIRKVKDERLAPMTYKKLKALGVSQRQWSGWTQEQANEYIRQHGERGESSNKVSTQANAYSKTTSLSNATHHLDIFNDVSAPNPKNITSSELAHINSVAKNMIPTAEEAYADAKQAEEKLRSDERYEWLIRRDPDYLSESQRKELNEFKQEDRKLYEQRSRIYAIKSALYKLSNASTAKEYSAAVKDYINEEANLIYAEILNDETDSAALKKRIRKARQDIISKYPDVSNIAKKATENSKYRSIMYY